MSKTFSALAFGALLVSMQSASTPDRSATIVEAWFEAMNALDGSSESVEGFVSLYHPDALHITGPEAHQIGTVTFDGAEALRLLALRIGQEQERIVYRIDVVTSNEQSRKLFHTAEGPWGGRSVAVQFHAAYTRRDDGVRFSAPGAAFFRLDGEKIRRLRIYFPDGERAEVAPLN